MFGKKLVSALFFISIALPSFASDASLYDSVLDEHKRGNYKKELRIIQKIEKKEGESAKTNLLKYRAYQELSMDDEAKEALLKAAETDNSNFDAHFSLAVFYIKNDDPSNARKYLERALEISPDLRNNPEVLYWYARLLISDEDMEKALEAILSAIEEDPYENVYYLELGKVYLFKKDYIKAVNAFSFAIGKNKMLDAECYNYLGLIQFRRRSYQKAKDYFEKAHQEDRLNIMYLHNLLLCLKALGEKNAYAVYMQELSSLIPQTPLDYLHLSQIAHDKSEYRKADEILNEGIKKFPNNLMLQKALKKLNKS